MKKCIIVIIALLCSLLDADTLFAVANTWTQKADFGGTERGWAAGFSIGGKGYIGMGVKSGPSDYKDFWEYDPAGNTWTQKADFGEVTNDAVGFSIGSKGYIGNTYGNDFWEYDPVANTWIRKADFGGRSRESAVGFSIGNKGYIGTGSWGYPTNYCKDFWEYDPAADTWTRKADFGGVAREAAVGFSIGGKGYIGTGYSGSVRRDFWEYDPVANTWTGKADFVWPDRYRAVGFSIGGKGYIGTGRDLYGNENKDFWEYDPVANTWIQKADFGGTKRQAAVGFSIGSKGYIGTGGIYLGPDDGWTFYYDFWEYNASTTPEIQVTPSALDFGNVPKGTGKQLTLAVKNTGIGILEGNATTTEPFSIVSGGSYSLVADQSQVITIRYQPTSRGTHTGTVVFTGGGGATVPVTGKTTEGFPSWLLLLLGD